MSNMLTEHEIYLLYTFCDLQTQLNLAKAFPFCVNFKSIQKSIPSDPICFLDFVFANGPEFLDVVNFKEISHSLFKESNQFETKEIFEGGSSFTSFPIAVFYEREIYIMMTAICEEYDLEIGALIDLEKCKDKSVESFIKMED